MSLPAQFLKVTMQILFLLSKGNTSFVFIISVFLLDGLHNIFSVMILNLNLNSSDALEFNFK